MRFKWGLEIIVNLVNSYLRPPQHKSKPNCCEICFLRTTYLINTGPSLSNKSNNYRTFTACYESKSHCGTPIEHNQSRFRWLFIIAIGIGLLVRCTFILMAECIKKKTIWYYRPTWTSKSKNKVSAFDKKHLLYVVRSAFRIDCFFPAIWKFSIMSPIFCGR